jgi:hypothetical protein
MLFSSIQGLGSLGYLSSIRSTFVSSLSLFSSLQGLGTLGYVSTPTLRSSLQGLGTLGYVSSLTLQSSLQGLGTLGYVSSATLTLALQAVGDSSYVSLTSTIVGLGTFGYLSSPISSFFTFSVQKLYASSALINVISTGFISLSTITLSDRNSTSTPGQLFQSSSLLFYNKTIIGGANAMNIQTFIF